MKPSDIRYIVVHCSATRADHPYPVEALSEITSLGASVGQATTSTSVAPESSIPCALWSVSGHMP